MSSWTEGEVLALKKAGNDRARATWLAKAPPCGQGGRPKEGDHIDVFKAFIVDVYERKRYYQEGGEEVPDPAASPQPFATVKAVASARQRAPPPPTPHNTLGAPADPAPAAPTIADLLDFGAFDGAVSSPAAPPPPSQPHVQAFFDPAPAAATPTQAQAQPTSFDAFGGFSSQQPSAGIPRSSAPSGLLPPPPPASAVLPPSDPFGLQPTMPAPSFDPFCTVVGGSNNNGARSVPTATEKPPAMKNVTGLAGGPTPVMAMPSPFGNPAMMMQQQTPMGNGMMGNNNGMMTMGRPMMGGPMGGPMMGGPMMGGNFPMMMGNSNPQMMMMMNAQQQMMMNQMGQQKPSNGMMMSPGIPFSGNSAMGSATGSAMMSSMGSMGGGTTTAMASSSRQPSFASQQQQQPKKYDPFAGIGL
jgi:hypothetical protein